ncbi:hypothetical protein SAMD00019534_047500 [Acytostelium subglobosum LB1]|uniref:hypothetical protein n=1 Tax=Acytostelium subglobosum LB1 TaxID=1410327 RepID=UPI000644F896|nr:hypothetical protein SAMD00019534_047500 [Acytostelium subglobosum LB1]GAM21575.1 hypothetical protein SAMD00019534_047500 [Acytostelium subglobosum LB1]|eukprot:XP_012755694.1 hypothetical protein SAMD00019534_047500 [Acytostelium subglobosum LB1]
MLDTLAHTILRQIIKYINEESALDVICLLLTSKSLFNIKHLFNLNLNTHKFKIIQQQDNLIIPQFNNIWNQDSVEWNNLKYLTLDNSFFDFEAPPLSVSLPPALFILLLEGFNVPIVPGSLPITLKELYLGDDYNQPLQVGSLPPNLDVLEFGNNYLQPIEVDILPNSIVDLFFGDAFDIAFLPGSLPTSLTTLHLGYYYNQPMENGVLPLGLTQLEFGVEFNQPLGRHNLPSTLQSLVLGQGYKLTFTPGSMPVSLTYIHGGLLFDQPLVPGVFDNLKTLHFGTNFNMPLTTGSLPQSINTIFLGDSFNHVIPSDTFPKSLQSIKFGYRYNKVIAPGVLPPNLIVLIMGVCFNQPFVPGCLPATLKILNLGRSGFNHTLTDKTLPDSLDHLRLGSCFNQHIVTLPPALTYLNMYPARDQHFTTGILPYKLLTLKLKHLDKDPLPMVLPDSITHLYLGSLFNQTISTGLPASLKYLRLGHNFNQEVFPDHLPSGIQSLKMDNIQAQLPKFKGIFNSVERLDIGLDQDQQIYLWMIPQLFPNLVTMAVNFKFNPAKFQQILGLLPQLKHLKNIELEHSGKKVQIRLVDDVQQVAIFLVDDFDGWFVNIQDQSLIKLLTETFPNQPDYI